MPRSDSAAWRSVVVGGVLLLSWTGSVAAHGFGQRYDLPVPLWLYMVGAAATVAFSFVVIGVFVRGTSGQGTYPRVNLLRSPVGRFLAHPVCLFCLKLASVGLFVLFILAGLLGHQNPAKNLAPTLVWVGWWVGLAYVSALGGNLWALINPWKVLFGWAEALYSRVAPGCEISRPWPYPRALGVWPGVLLFLGFAWVELVFQGAAIPANLAIMALVYSGITWTGMFLTQPLDPRPAHCRRGKRRGPEHGPQQRGLPRFCRTAKRPRRVERPLRQSPQGIYPQRGTGEQRP